MIMRDSVTAANIPTDTPVVAGYGDGIYQWSANDWARFPHSVRLSIVVSAAHQGDILDVETGNATPEEAGTWARTWHPRHGRRRPTIYCNRASWPAVKTAVGSTPVDYWISTLDGTKEVEGAVAVQYTDTGTYDESVILDESWISEMSIDVARLHVMGWYLSILHRVPSQAEVDGWAGQLATPGANFEDVLTAFYSTPEAEAHLAADSHLPQLITDLHDV